MDSVHSRISLEHQRLQDSFILDSFRREDSLDKILQLEQLRMKTFRASSYLRRNSIELQIPLKSIHASSEVGLGV